MPENVGASTSRNPKGLHGLYRDNFFLPLYFMASLRQKVLNYILINFAYEARENSIVKSFVISPHTTEMMNERILNGQIVKYAWKSYVRNFA
jgi:hypothetical protein